MTSLEAVEMKTQYLLRPTFPCKSCR